MKEIKKGKNDFIKFTTTIEIPKFIFINLNNMYLPNCKNNKDKINFLIIYYLMNHK